MYRNIYTVDFNKIGEELAVAKEADLKYSRENDAKFRALDQKVSTYEEFRGIVLASHLKPLEKTDTFSRKSYQPWNMIATKTQTDILLCQKTHPKKNIKQNPQSFKEFAAAWNCMNDSTGRYELLLNISKEDFQKIFFFELDCFMLGEMMVILDENFKIKDANKIAELLMVLPLLKRFKLSKELFSKSEKTATNSLMKKLCGECYVAGIDDLQEQFHFCLNTL